MYLCYIEDSDGAVMADSILLFSNEMEAEFWKRIINKTYRDDRAIIKEIEVEPKMWEKKKNAS